MSLRTVLLLAALIALASTTSVWADAAVDDDDARAQFGSDPLDTSAGASDDATAEEVVNEAANDAEPTVDDTPNIRVHMLTDIPAPSADIVTAVVFPNNQNKDFPIGEISTVVVGIQNRGSKPINVTNVCGSLNSQFQFHVYIQNFTQQNYGQMIDSGMEASYEFKFFPATQLEPMALAMALTVFYEDVDTAFGSTFFNATVNFVDPAAAPFDVRSTFKLVLVLAVSAVIAVVFFKSSARKPTRRSARTATVTETTYVEGEFAKKFLERSNRASSAGRATTKKD